MEEPEKAKAGSGESKIIKAAGVSKDGLSMQAVMEARLEKMEDQCEKANAGTEGLELGRWKWKQPE